MLHEEYKIQVAIFKHHQSAFPWIKFVFVPNASKDAATGFFNKQLGLQPGAHDIHLFYSRNSIEEKPSQLKVLIFEVKSESGRLTTSQNRYASEMHQLGAYTGYGSTVRSYHECLVRHGIKPLHNGIQEPNLQTEQEKFKDAFDFYKPRKE